jgi:WD40 repeat protein
VIFVGPGGDGPWQSEEMRDILKRAVKSHNEFRAIPALLPNASAAALEKSFLGSRLWIEFKSVDDADALMRLAKAIQGEASGGDSLKLPDKPAPYRGLERFERIEKPEEDFFFGRDEEIRALVGRLVKERFVAVVGASGSGKSSLVRAGLTKQLAEDIHPGIRRWTTITVEPGSAPFRSLAIQIAVAAGIPVADRERWIEQTVEKWTAAPDGVRQTVETLFADAKETLLIFIDQFEELFTHRLEGPESDSLTRNFVANLADLWRNRGDRVRVAMALRADFVARCLEIGPLKELLQDHTMLVGEVGDDALREIVKEPAARVGAFLEKGLMERILKDVRSGSGSLPLLQQALHGLWRNRTGPWLTHDAYTASGGVARALNDQAQAAFKALDDGQKTIADSLFLRLITLGEGMADTRRRVERSELYPRGVDPDAVNAVIDRLSGKDARILVTTRAGGKAEDLASGEDFVEFTHEALLSNWEHLVKLLETERTSIRRHRGLTTAAAEWESTPDDQRQKFLLRSGQLIIAEQWATSQGGYARMTDLEARFLKASTDERDAEEDRKAKVARRLKFLSIGATAAAIIAMVIGGFAFQQKEKAIASEKKAAAAREEAQIGQINALSRTSEALLASNQQFDDLDALISSLHAAKQLKEVSFPDATLRARVRGTLQKVIYGVKERDRIDQDKGKIISGLNADGSKLPNLEKYGFVCYWGNLVCVWDRSGEQMAAFLEPKHSPKSIIFSPDGSKLIIASEKVSDDGSTSQDSPLTLRLWDLKSKRPLAEFKGRSGDVWSVSFCPDASRIAIAGDKGIRLWDANGKEIPEFRGGQGRVTRVVFSPDGTKLAAVTSTRYFNFDTKRMKGDVTVSLWDLKGQRVGQLKGDLSLVDAVMFSPDGTKLATTGSDEPVVRLWDLAGKQVSEIKGILGGVIFSPDGSLIAGDGKDGIPRVWDLLGNQLFEFKGHQGGASVVIFTPEASRWLPREATTPSACGT